MFGRKSKFKHIVGKPNKKEFCYDDIRITKSTWDSTFCSVNPKYLALITEAVGGGAFLVLPIEKYGRVERDAPLVAGHQGAVLCIEWCPHNDDLIASGSEDCTAKVWRIPDGGLQSGGNLTTPVADLVAHERRVGLVKWHPTAEYVLLTAGADCIVYIWKAFMKEKLITINFPDMVLSASFNWNGSRLVTTCKDRRTRILDPRKGSIIKENICHQGTKPQQAVYLKDGRIITTGFSPMSERQLALWAKDDVSTRLAEVDLDVSNGIMFPFYDPDSSLIFLCGKGDCSMRYFEVTDEEPYLFFIDMMITPEPQRGIGWMPKRGLNVTQNEIARFYKLHTRGFCEIISFVVPRKSNLYQDDLYPDTAGDVPALSPDEWMSGKDAAPVLISLKNNFVNCGNGVQKNDKLPSALLNSKQEPARHKQKTNSSGATTTDTSGDVVKLNDSGKLSLEELLDDMRKMKIIIKGHERRINRLECQLDGRL